MVFPEIGSDEVAALFPARSMPEPNGIRTYRRRFRYDFSSDWIRMNNRQTVSTRVRQLLAVLSKQPQKTVIRIAVTGGFVYAVNKNLSLPELRGLLVNVAPLPLVIAFVLSAASLLLQVLRWPANMCSSLAVCAPRAGGPPLRRHPLCDRDRSPGSHVR